FRSSYLALPSTCANVKLKVERLLRTTQPSVKLDYRKMRQHLCRILLVPAVAVHSRQAADMETAQHQQQAEYRLVQARMHDVAMPLFLYVSDLWAILELPAYSLRPPFREPRNLGTPDPAQDMQDEDHGDTARKTSVLLEKLQGG
ncbi:hypothetical protein JG688_00015490, partial [Phytophthora aleatoria]